MTIERDAEIQFHEQGTLNAVTRWISNHADGLAEWLKNVRRAYQVDRADVAEEDRVCAILLRDADDDAPGLIGLLDVGGASKADLDKWCVWQDPRASVRGEGVEEEQTQGNGGKAYMYRLFKGPARLLGVASEIRNARGFEGEEGSVERGTPGFVPNRAEAKDAPAGPWKVELNAALEPYGLTFDDLPAPLRAALENREAFTLVEGSEPKDDGGPVFQGRVDGENLVRRVIMHEQTTLALEQMRIFAIHNGEALFEGESVALEEIPPHPGFEPPRIIEIPEVLKDEAGRDQDTTQGGTRPKGRIVLRTSKDNMPNAWRRLRPRWRVSYRTAHQMIGSKPVSELVPTAPGSHFVYATVELPALEPDYVTHGRERPNDGPLVSAVDLFTADAIRDLAREINQQRKQELDEQELDAVAQENRLLDKWKDQFLPEDMQSDDGGPGPKPPRPKPEPGLEPHEIVVREPDTPFLVGEGVTINLDQILSPKVRDAFGRPVHGVSLTYHADPPEVLQVDAEDGMAVALKKGECHVWVTIEPIGLSSALVPMEVWAVDHVLLSPRQLEIPVGKRKQVTAEVTNDDGDRSTDVFLDWRHSADDHLMVRVSPAGFVSANRVGSTEVTAGAGDPETGVWSRIPAVVEVVPSTDPDETGEGKPRLLLTGRDKDPETGLVREGDPEEPVLWQLPSDMRHNVWWLNLEAPEALFAFGRRESQPHLWRMFHGSQLVEMVTQVHMHDEYISKGESEVPENWAQHKAALERKHVAVATSMWEGLSEYVLSGEGL